MKKKENNYITNTTSRRNFIKSSSLLAGGLVAVPSLNNFSNKVTVGTNNNLNVKEENSNIIIDSSYFAFCLNTTNGLKAVWWHNKISDRQLNMGNGDEVEFTLGLPGGNIKRPTLRINKLPKVGLNSLNEVIFEL